MVMTIAFQIDGLRELVRTLDQMPAVCRSRVLVPAAERAGKTLVKAIARLTPYNMNRKRGVRAYHYRDVLNSVVRDYPKTQSVVLVVGPESGKAPHAHLVEDGTKQRFTNSKPKYMRMKVRARQIIKNGRLRWVTETEKKSIGSLERKKGKPRLNRGRMPAFHSLQRGVSSIELEVGNQLKADITSGITRELTQFRIASESK